MADLPSVGIIGTGGTISSWAEDPLELVNYPVVGRKLQVGEVLEKFPELNRVVTPVPFPFRAVGSPAVGVPEWLELAQMIERLSREHPELKGFVVVHGTATLEETAYFLNLTVKVAQPVILVGAQRPASALSSDAGLNLLAACRVAAAPAARGRGVLVVLNDTIQAARDVTKTSTLRLQTFDAPGLGPLGYADPDAVMFYRRPERRHTTDTPFDVGNSTTLPRVDIALSYAGSDGTAVQAFASAGARGLVAAGLAPGLAPPLERQALAEAIAAGIPIVLATRSPAGRVVQSRWLDDLGAIAADDLSPQKARILLMLALAAGMEGDEIKEAFANF